MPSKTPTFRMESIPSTPRPILTLAQRRLTGTPPSGALTSTPINRPSRGELRVRTSPGCVRALVERYESQVTPPESPSQRVVSGGYFQGKHDGGAGVSGCAVNGAFESKDCRMRVLTPQDYHVADRSKFNAGSGVQKDGLHKKEIENIEAKVDLDYTPSVYETEGEYEHEDEDEVNTHSTDTEIHPGPHHSLLVPGLRITKGGVTVQHPARLSDLPPTPPENEHGRRESFGQVIAEITNYINLVQHGITPTPLTSTPLSPDQTVGSSASSMYPAPLFSGRDPAKVMSFWKNVRQSLHVGDSELESPVSEGPSRLVRESGAETCHYSGGRDLDEDDRMRDSARMSEVSNNSAAGSTLERKLSDLERFVGGWGTATKIEAREKRQKRSVGNNP